MTPKTTLAASTTDLLLDVGLGRFVPMFPQLANVAHARWAELDAPACSGTVALQGSLLRLLMNDFAGGFGVRNQAGSFSLSDGSEINAELVHMPRIGAQAEVELHHWVWRAQGEPRFWIGTLSGRLPRPGNLWLQEKCGNARAPRHAFRLEGRFVWYVIATKDDTAFQVVIDAGDLPPKREELVKDVLSLEFASGTPLRVSPLVGVDDRRQVVAAMSVGNYERRGNGRRPPIPDRYTLSAWLPELFHRVSAKFHADGFDPLLRAVGAYVDSVNGHLDGCYLTAQVGLEAFAKRITHGADRPLLVRNEAEWRKWIKTLRPTVLEHLKDPKAIDGVMQKLSATRFAPTGRIVADALGTTLPVEVLEEIGNRDTSAHELFMNPGPEHEIDRDDRRLQMVQTVLVALVAKHVGYHGPLQGYAPNEKGERPSPDWWPVSLSEDDLPRFEGIRVVSDRLAVDVTAS